METTNLTTVAVPLAEHEEMDRWKRLPIWAQQELEYWRQYEAFQRGQVENAELALSIARDIVNAWPTMTIRTISQMTARVETLKQALEMASK